MKHQTLHFILLTVLCAVAIDETVSLPTRPAPAPVKGLTKVTSESGPAKGSLLPEKPINAILDENLPQEASAVSVSSELPIEEVKKEVDKNVPKFSEPEKVTEVSISSTEAPKFKVLDGPIFKKGYPTKFSGPEGKIYKLPLSEAELEYLSKYGSSRYPKPRLHFIESGVTENTKNVKLLYVYMHIGNFLMYIGDDFETFGKDD